MIMRRSVVLVVVFIMAFTVPCFAKVVKRHYPNGALEAVVKYDSKGIRNGRYKTYWPNGKLRETGVYKNGRLVGVQKLYSIDGEAIN